MTDAGRSPSGARSRWPLPILILAMLSGALVPMAATDAARGDDLVPVDHLVVSEVVTGGASASDELIELHNPTAGALPLEGLEVVYVTATGATISRRATWAVGAPSVPAGGHVLIANEAGIFAAVADATYASGIAATGGSVAIRILGASTAIDAVGWGTAANPWMEGTPVPSPSAGASIERLPGGAMGSGQDSGDNLADFVERLVPDPQNLASPQTPDPGPTPFPVPTPIPTPTPVPTPIPTATPPAGPATTSIADARAAPDGTTLTIEGVALTGSEFHDGGGFVADATGGIAVLLAEGTYVAGARIRVTGDVDDRFSQRTLRADPGAVTLLGSAAGPAPTAVATGAVGESVEGRLVAIHGAIVGSATSLTSGLAFDVDDGSGSTRVLVPTASGIDTASWLSDAKVELVGVAGQRDSTGSGSEGYRVMPRMPADVISVLPPGSASPTPGAGGVTSIAVARTAAKNAPVRIRGVVTLPSGLVDERTAVLQDATGAMLIRLEGQPGRLRLGDRVEVDGRRSTLGGMESVRATESIVSLGTGSDPSPRSVRTGEVGEADEATLVIARGAIVASARRSSLGTVSFEIDDGSGPLRVSVSATLRADDGPLVAGTWVEVRGVLGQETTRSSPSEGYRIWPRSTTEVRVTAAAVDGSGNAVAGGAAGGSAPASGAPAGSLDDLDDVNLSDLRIGATLVVGSWKELDVAGLLWDGTRLVAVHASSAEVVAMLTRGRGLPLSLDLGGLRAAGTEPITGVPVVQLGTAPDATTVIDAPPAAPSSTVGGERPTWASVVGRLSGSAERRVVLAGGDRVTLDARCRAEPIPTRDTTVAVTGIALDEPLRLLVPCNGVRQAPSVARSRGADLPGVAGASRGSAAGALAAADVRRPIAAGLLLVAALILVSAAVVRRFEPSDPRPDDEAGEPSLASAARLTLVRVPHEPGP